MRRGCGSCTHNTIFLSLVTLFDGYHQQNIFATAIVPLLGGCNVIEKIYHKNAPSPLWKMTSSLLIYHHPQPRQTQSPSTMMMMMVKMIIWDERGRTHEPFFHTIVTSLSLSRSPLIHVCIASNMVALLFSYFSAVFPFLAHTRTFIARAHTHSSHFHITVFEWLTGADWVWETCEERVHITQKTENKFPSVSPRLTRIPPPIRCFIYLCHYSLPPSRFLIISLNLLSQSPPLNAQLARQAGRSDYEVSLSVRKLPIVLSSKRFCTSCMYAVATQNSTPDTTVWVKSALCFCSTNCSRHF